MIRRITFSVASVSLGIIISPLIALAVGLMMFLVTFLDFWKGLITSLCNYPNTDKANETKKIKEWEKTATVWEKHMKSKGILPEETAEN